MLHETTETTQGADPVAPHRLPLYLYWIGHAHAASVRAASEDEARAAILAQFPHARGQRLKIRPFILD